MIKIYLDNCCYNRPFDKQNQDLIRLETEAKLIIQNKIKQGIYLLVWSFILDSENDENFSDDKRKAIGLWKFIAEEYCASSDDILTDAKKLMQFGLKHKDALHLACAIKSKCDYFITTDKKFYNKNSQIERIEIVNPMNFIIETEEINEK